MTLFTGNACFSPRVPSEVQRKWVENGGKIASVRCEDAHATHVFCDGSDDPWFRSLYKRSMVIFHWSWISAVVREQFRLPTSSYLIEDDLSHDLAAYTHDSAGFLGADDSGTHLDSADAAAGWYSTRESYLEKGPDHSDAAYYLQRSLTPAPDGIAGDISLEGKTLVLDSPPYRLLSASDGAMSINGALEALDDISVDGVVQFLPGTMHMGKEFRCSYAY